MLGNLPRASIGKLLRMSGHELCTNCDATGLVDCEKDYLGDRIVGHCPVCAGTGFVQQFVGMMRSGSLDELRKIYGESK
jgi:DnaJ-class molecular chaperone